MSKSSTGRRNDSVFEKRGGYGSSSKPVAELRPPRSGPAPGAKPSPTANGTTKKK